MKNTIILSAAVFLLFACGGKKEAETLDVILASNDITKIRAKKGELDAQQQELNNKLYQLEEKIKELDPQLKIPLVTTFVTEEAEFDHYVELQGNVTTKQNLIVFPEYSGVLSEVYVREGQRVSEGQQLAKIEDGGLSQQLEQMKIQSELAKTVFERQKRLWDQEIGSEIAYLEAKSSYEGQQRLISQLEEQIAKTVIRAPFAGTIDEIITEKGSVVSPGMSQLFRIVNLRDMYVETDVPESYISDIRPGKKVEVEFPVLGLTLNSKVRQAGNFINPANRTFKIQVGVRNNNNHIKPNLTAKLKINDYTNNKAILIPQSIVSENAAGEQFVYVVENLNNNMGVAKQVIIQTGRTQEDVVEVLEGIKSGDQIIDEGARSVKDNQEVKILELAN